jgi:GDSL-like Lipase/Acylhydrolase family
VSTSARKTGLWLLTTLVTVGIMLVLGEILIGLASPSEYLYPRYQFSAEYGLIPFPNVVMVHGIPRKFEFHYTVNSMQSRGAVVAPHAGGLPDVVVLGDSYSFGMGVSDGEEYPTVMRAQLSGRANVINLGEPGWGLTQEIRRYYDTGAKYDPRIVVLQFCANDPYDNLDNRVTVVENGDFKFVDSANSLNFVKKYLSRSIVQRTQLYNFFRTRASHLVLDRMTQKAASRLDKTAAPSDSAKSDVIPGVERAYIELLQPFAAKLHAEGRALWVISVDHQLEQFPHINAAVHDLDARGELHYFEVTDWLKGHEPHGSPEGHLWGAPAHALIGAHLAAEASSALGGSLLAPRS